MVAFQCGIHSFSTDNIILWDEHCKIISHTYDLQINCANKCGKRLHIKPRQKLSPESNQIPKGYVCGDCKNKIQSVPEIKGDKL